MSLAAAAVALSGAMFNHVALDADAQGRAQLAWSGWRGDRLVARVYDVTTRRTHELQGIHGLRGSVELEDFDVAASGAAVACVRDQRDRDKRGWRVRVFRRTPAGAWSRAITVAATGVYVDDLVCGVGDAGQVSLAWVEGPRSKHAAGRARRSGRGGRAAHHDRARPDPGSEARGRRGRGGDRRPSRSVTTTAGCSWPGVPPPVVGRRARSRPAGSRSSRSTAPAGRWWPGPTGRAPIGRSTSPAAPTSLPACCCASRRSASARWPRARAATCSWSGACPSGSARATCARPCSARAARSHPRCCSDATPARSRRCSRPTAAARSSSAPARSIDPARCSASCVPTAAWSAQRPSGRHRRAHAGRPWPVHGRHRHLHRHRPQQPLHAGREGDRRVIEPGRRGRRGLDAGARRRAPRR